MNFNVLLLRQFEVGLQQPQIVCRRRGIMPWGNRSFQSMMILTQQRSWDTVVCDEMWTG